MNQEIDTIDSSQMEVLSEFAYEGDARTMEQLRNVVGSYRLGVLNSDFIIASQSDLARKPEMQKVPAGVNELQKKVFEDSIKRNWWRGEILFELKNFAVMLERIEEVYGLRQARKIDLNEPEIISGKDKAGVRLNSITPHNAGKPIVSFQINNYRRAKLDDLDAEDWYFYTSAETGRKIMEEMRRIQPIIKKN